MRTKLQSFVDDYVTGMTALAAWIWNDKWGGFAIMGLVVLAIILRLIFGDHIP